LCECVGVRLKLSPIENHKAIGLNESLHSPLIRIYNKVLMTVAGLPTQIALRVALKALNDSVGPNGLIPTLLVFGTMPQLPMLQGRMGPYSFQEARDRAINTAMKEYRTYVAEQRIREALKSHQTDSMKQAYSPSATVLAHREDDKLWTGPYSVVQQNGKIVTVQRSTDAPTQRFNVSSVKPYYKSSRGDAEENDEDAPLDRVMITDILAPNDPRQFSNAFMKAKLQELEGLKKNGTWQEVWSHEVPKGANKMTGLFVLTTKEKGTEKEVLKARFVAQGYKDRAKDCRNAFLAR
jgi:hypothetical protein